MEDTKTWLLFLKVGISLMSKFTKKNFYRTKIFQALPDKWTMEKSEKKA